MESESIISRIMRLNEERKSYIYDWDKILPENRIRFEEIQKELCEIEEIFSILKWHKVSDRLPQHHDRVLLYSPYTKSIEIGALINSGWGLDKSYMSDHSHSGYHGSVNIGNFTHWMHLPEIPNVCLDKF